MAPSVTRLFEAKVRPGDEVFVLLDTGNQGEDIVLGIFTSEDSLTDWFYQWLGRMWVEHDIEEELQALLDGTSGSSLRINKMKIDPEPGS